jgi:hypothetical protein
MLDIPLEPFALGFMRRALAGCLALPVAAPPGGLPGAAADDLNE